MDAPQPPPPLPLVSVLIPAYNHARFVQRCLDSVLEDPYPHKELVIVDDGSSDGTAERIAEWIARHGDKLHVRFWPRENLGIAATLNHLVAMARGEFLRLGASDDYLLPGGLGVQVAYLGAHPHKAAVIGDAIVVDAQDRTVHQSSMRDLHRVDKRLYLSEAGIRRAVIRHWAVSGAVALVRRSALQPGAAWDEGLRIEDWDFFLRLVARDALGFLDVAVCAYRVHARNASRTRHLPSRLANLAESRQVALRRARLFDPACRTLLQAQAHYIAAKIAFLRRSPLALGGHLLAHAWLSLLARLRQRGQPALAQRT